MNLDAGANTGSSSLPPNSTIEVVKNSRHDRDQNERNDKPTNQELDERQLKHVKANVFAELWIVHPKGLRVSEEKITLPLTDTREPSAKSKNDGESGIHSFRVRLDRHLISKNHLVFRSCEFCGTADSINDHQVDEQTSKKDQTKNEKDSDFYREKSSENLLLSN